LLAVTEDLNYSQSIDAYTLSYNALKEEMVTIVVSVIHWAVRTSRRGAITGRLRSGSGGHGENRTRDKGFADPCLTTWLRGPGERLDCAGSAPRARVARGLEAEILRSSYHAPMLPADHWTRGEPHQRQLALRTCAVAYAADVCAALDAALLATSASCSLEPSSATTGHAQPGDRLVAGAFPEGLRIRADQTHHRYTGRLGASRTDAERHA
jgi:hypothetical protein